MFETTTTASRKAAFDRAHSARAASFFAFFGFGRSTR